MNVAREAATTGYVFVSHPYFYTTLNASKFVWDFLKDHKYSQEFFVIPVFKIATNVQIPTTIEEIFEMYTAENKSFFEKEFCTFCSDEDLLKRWFNDTSMVIRILKTINGKESQQYWQPCFISSNNAPFLSENFDDNKQFQVIFLLFSVLLLTEIFF